MNPELLTKNITTFTLFGFKAGEKYWAFKQMGSAPFHLAKVPGLKFFKLMGAGDGLGFSIIPDFGRYALMAVWENKEASDRFFSEDLLYAKYQVHTFEIWTVYLNPLSAHGLWSSKNPFEDKANDLDKKLEDNQKPIAILTRAAIRTAKLYQFWKNVPATSEAVANAEGLIASIGVGEWPVVRQATVSLWKNMEFARKFAYHDKVHTAVIKKTREQNWYKEEMFARFIVKGASGLWNGKEPVSEFLNAREKS